MSPIEISAANFEKFLMVLMRVGGMMFTAPLFSHRNIPPMAKIGLIGIFSLVLVPVIPSPPPELLNDLGSVIGVVAKELVAGLLMGFMATTIMIGIQVAGELVAFQMGFAIVQALDPSSSSNVSIISEFQFIMAILIFLAIDGHHLLINAVAGSFQVIPPGMINFSSASVEVAIRFCINVLAIGLKIGAPVIVTLFLTDVALGIMARTVPQMNVFIVGMPLKIGTGFLILAASFPFFSYVFTKLLQSMDRDLTRLITALAPRT